MPHYGVGNRKTYLLNQDYRRAAILAYLHTLTEALAPYPCLHHHPFIVSSYTTMSYM